MIYSENLCLEYPDGLGTKQILTNVNFSSSAGENIILLGPSGSGKSSLIYLLSSLRKPTSGKVIFNGIDMTALNEKENTAIRKKSFGFIFQLHFLLPYLSAVENVMTAKNCRDQKTKDEAVELLSKLGLAGHEDKKLHALSGGERQRVAIARAIMNNPDIIFADEPTASLDHKTAVEVIDILKNYKKNSVLIMATHDTSILKGDEKVLKIENKGIKE